MYTVPPYILSANRSPPRTRRSSTSSTGSSGNGGYSGGLSLTSGGLATAKRASRARSRSPSPRVSTAGKLSAPVDVNRRSRSPTPRAADRLAVHSTAASRSRSVTPRRKRRSASPPADGLSVPDGGRSRSPSAASRHGGGVDDTPTPRISLNFAAELATEVDNRLSRESSVDAQPSPREHRNCSVEWTRDDDVAVDTSSTCRVSDNFRGTEHYHVLNPTPVAVIERRHSTVREEKSEVDTTPFCRVSDSLRAATHDGPPVAGVRKKSHSSAYRDAKKSEPVGTDSGSEVSDEGYRSLGVVTTPPANSTAKTAPKFNGKQYYVCVRITLADIEKNTYTHTLQPPIFFSLLQNSRRNTFLAVKNWI